MKTINIHIEKLIDQVVIDESVVENQEIRKSYKNQIIECVTESLFKVMDASYEVFLISTDLNKEPEITPKYKAPQSASHHYRTAILIKEVTLPEPTLSEKMKRVLAQECLSEKKKIQVIKRLLDLESKKQYKDSQSLDEECDKIISSLISE